MRHNKIKSIAQEERLYRRANELSRKHKIPFAELLMGVSVIGEDGTRRQVIFRHSRSLVRNFYNRKMNIMVGANNASGYTDGGLQAKDTGGAIRELNVMFAQTNIEDNAYPYGFAAAAGDSAQGMQIGTGTTAEDFDDYRIETQIAHGVSAGQMGYLGMVHTHAWYSGPSYYLKNYERTFDNDSGSTINVSEATLVWQNQYGWFFAMSHDVFAPIAVLHTEGLAVFYEFRLTYP